jgi:uncharacterized membrane protein YfcA
MMGTDWVLVAELLVLGCVSGFLAGLLGIGGGMLLVPALTFLASVQGFASDYVVKMAVAMSLATIWFTSLSSVRAHHRRGAVRWDVVGLLAPGIVMGSLLGAQIARLLSTRMLALVFAVFVSYSAVQMFIDKKPRPSRQLPQGAGMFGAGGVIGTLSSLVGPGAVLSRCRSWPGATCRFTRRWPPRRHWAFRLRWPAPSAMCSRAGTCRARPAAAWATCTCRPWD